MAQRSSAGRPVQAPPHCRPAVEGRERLPWLPSMARIPRNPSMVVPAPPPCAAIRPGPYFGVHRAPLHTCSRRPLDAIMLFCIMQSLTREEVRKPQAAGGWLWTPSSVLERMEGEATRPLRTHRRAPSQYGRAASDRSYGDVERRLEAMQGPPFRGEPVRRRLRQNRAVRVARVTQVGFPLRVSMPF